MLGRFALSVTGAVALVVTAMNTAFAGEQLIMVEERGCFWCARWNSEISEIYPKTPEGQRAPLRRIDLRAPLPEDLHLARKPVFTPTFILVSDGVELSRIEGYPGEDFFWGLIGKMLQDNTDFAGAS